MCQHCGIDNCFNGCGCDTTEQDILESRLNDIEEYYKLEVLTREEAIKQVRYLIDTKYESEQALKQMGIILEEWEE